MKKSPLLLLLSAAFMLNAGTIDFEKPSKEWVVRTYVGYKNVLKAPGMSFERSGLKAHNGNFSLELNSTLPERTFHFNYTIERPAAQGGVELKFHYFIAESENKPAVSGRIMQLDAKGRAIKPLKFFTASTKKGEWQSVSCTVYPKPECRRLQATIWFKGKMRSYLDDVSFGAAQRVKASAGKAEILAQGAFGTWFAAPADRRVPRTGVPGNGQKISVLRLKAAKGEKTAVILGVAPKAAAKRLELEISAPGAFKNMVRVNTLGFIEMRNPDNPAMKGFHSDPLLPESFATGTPGINSCFYVEFAVPRTGVSGVLKGEIKLKADGKVIASTPYELKVRNFALPQYPRLKTYMPIRAHKGFRKFDRRKINFIVDDMLQLCRDERINPQGGVEVTAPKFEIRNGLPAVTDWSGFDASVKKLAVDCGFDRVRLPLPTFGAHGGWFLRGKGQKEPLFMGKPLLSDEGLKYLGEVTRLYYERLKQKFPWVIGYAFFYDEPPAWLTKDVQKLFRSVMKSAPDCKIYVTGGHSLEYIDSAFAFCMPLAPGFLWSEKERNRLGNREIWHYNWNAPLDNNTYHINRLYPWLCYTVNSCGALGWHSNHTGSLTNPCNPWTDMELTYGCGSVAMFYPPRKAGEKIVPSIRLRHRGDSLEDYDYLKLLEECIDKYYPGQGRKRVLEIIKEVIPEAPFKYLNDPDKITSVRERIGDEIESFPVKPVVLLRSNPVENSELLLPEINFTLLAPAGTLITAPDGKKYTAGKNGKVEFKGILPKLGKNKLEFTVVHGKAKKTIFRQYTLLADPLLKEFKTLAVSPADKALLKKCESSVYTPTMRTAVAKRISIIKKGRLTKDLTEARKLTSPLSKALVRQAEMCFKWNFPERTAYYIALAKKVPVSSGRSAVKVTPFVQKEHFGIELDNGIVSARFLETGGRMISFKVNKVETFARPEWKKVLSAKERARRQPAKELVLNMPEYGGMEDASGNNHRWTISAVDWDMEILELSDKQAAIAFSSMIPGTPFKLRRVATLRSGASEIQFDYNIRNTAPADLQSDDPESFRLPWRLRLLPGIGADEAAHDLIGLPTLKAMPKVRMNTGDPSFYSGLFPLTKPAIGAFDSKAQCGFILTGSPEIVSFSYTWFDDRSRNPAKKPLYTLEVLRSFLLKKPGDKNANSPLSILPGKELSFRVYLKGFSGADGEKAWNKIFKK